MAPMSDIKPWMRRAAEQFLNRPNQLLLSQEHASRYIAEAIAAHAPPAELLANALEDAVDRVAFAAECDEDGSSGDHMALRKVTEAIDVYEAWLQREEGDPK